VPSVFVIDNQQELDELVAGIVADFEGLTSSDSGRTWAEDSVGIAEESMRQGFEQSKAPNGSGWAPNAPSTIKRKGHGVVLRETGRLGVSLTQETHPDAVVEIVAEPSGCGFSRGTSVEYSGFNQNGTKRIPARPHVGLTEEACDEMTELGADLAIEHLKAGA
jgi:phage gpG-like protein